MRNAYLVPLIYFWTIALCYSQNDKETSFVFRCSIQEKASGHPIAFAHIFNESRKYGILADTNGYFATNVKLGDTLAVIALGYLSRTYIISVKDTCSSIIYLQSRAYQIEEVSVEIPRNYTEFKEAFMKIEVNKNAPMKELPKHNPYKTPQLLDTNIISKPAYFIFHPVSAWYLKYNKEEKSKRKVWHLQQQELRQAKVDQKYNRKLVQKITGFANDELINFMGWCNFSFNYLYELTPFEITEAIQLKYENYLFCCYEGKKHDSITKGN